MQRLAIVFLVVLSAGCAYESTVGPVPLRDAQHMADYLAGAKAWELWNQEKPAQFWEFEQDGIFTVWIEGKSDSDLSNLFPGRIPSGVRKLTGKWQATTMQLQLSDVNMSSGEALEPFTLNLKWVDGKLRIEIGGHHYMRQM